MNDLNRQTQSGKVSKAKKKIIVFGGSGFLGSYVAEALTNTDSEVTVFDIKESPVLGLNQELVVGDILDRELVNKTIKGADYVYNFSGIADIKEAAERPVDTITYNILGNTIIIDACIRHKIKRFLFASTVYVYSNHGSFYRASKQAVESIIEAYHERYGLEYTILRYGSLYGPRAQCRMEYTDIFMKLLLKVKLLIKVKVMKEESIYMFLMPQSSVLKF